MSNNTPQYDAATGTVADCVILHHLSCCGLDDLDSARANAIAE